MTEDELKVIKEEREALDERVRRYEELDAIVKVCRRIAVRLTKYADGEIPRPNPGSPCASLRVTFGSTMVHDGQVPVVLDEKELTRADQADLARYAADLLNARAMRAEKERDELQ